MAKQITIGLDQVKLGEFMRVELLTMNKNIARQIRVTYDFDDSDIALGWIAMDALCSGSREYVLVLRGKSLLLAAFTYKQYMRATGKELTQIYLK